MSRHEEDERTEEEVRSRHAGPAVDENDVGAQERARHQQETGGAQDAAARPERAMPDHAAKADGEDGNGDAVVMFPRYREEPSVAASTTCARSTRGSAFRNGHRAASTKMAGRRQRRARGPQDGTAANALDCHLKGSPFSSRRLDETIHALVRPEDFAMAADPLQHARGIRHARPARSA